jgi:glycosyltransferase involved in cell wall biosynthesis
VGSGHNRKNILHISRPDSKGSGAGAFRIHRSLLKNGYNSKLLVIYNEDIEPEVYSIYSKFHWRILTFRGKIVSQLKKRFHLNSKPLNRDSKYSGSSFDEKVKIFSTQEILKIVKVKPDIIFLYFINGFLNTQNISELYKITNAKIYWYLMDMAALTGGCHFAWDCRGYINKCGICPALYSDNSFDLSYQNLNFKKENLKEIPISLIIGSDWLIEKAQKSSLFRNVEIKKIMLSIDPTVFHPGNKDKVRETLNLPLDKKIIFFGAQSLHEERKGIKYILESLKILEKLISNSDIQNNLFIIYAGYNDNYIESLNFMNKSLGRLDLTNELPKAYQASDIFVSSSIQDTGPYMICEAIMSGIPVVSFDMGLAKELVITGKTGYKAKISDPNDLALGLLKILSLSPEEYYQMSKNCLHLGLELLSPDIQLSKFKEILN